MKSVRDWIKTINIFVVIYILIYTVVPVHVMASENQSEVSGKVYELSKNSDYEFGDSDYMVSNNENTYGSFFISGNFINVGEKDDIPSYEVADGNLSLFYNYDDTKLNADTDSWHLVNDKSKTVNDLTLDSKIGKGALIVQTSKDQMNWVDVYTIANAFSDIPVRSESIYQTTDIQLINGCYYRVIVAYEQRIRTEARKFLFINSDKYTYKKNIEVYEFYAYSGIGKTDSDENDQIYKLGTKVRVEDFDGYFGQKSIDEKDIHYGWDLGEFFVSGYTDEVKTEDNTVVFLKNVGDKVTLWFKLDENIDAICGKKGLTVTPDHDGYDQYFETPKMDFGKGALIVKYTDYKNVSSDPIIYTNYLEANASVDADTKVQVFEEGDYEIALDYEITSDEFIDKIGHYRIYFKFLVRNGNCMAYPFDIETGNELTNSSWTENGFRIDLAKSRYLKVNVKREVLTESADGLVEDTRLNGPARDGAEYTEEGIYTITTENIYTNQTTIKKLYVGSNNVLKAYMTTGLSIPEINKLISEGATVSNDGYIFYAESDSLEFVQCPAQKNDKTQYDAELIYVLLIVAIGVGLIYIAIRRRKKFNQTEHVKKNTGEDA